MRKFIPIALTCSLLSFPAFADTQNDINYIVDQTVTRDLFAAAIEVQRPMLVSFVENEFRKKGLTINDSGQFFDIFMEEWIDGFTASMRRQTGQIYADLFSADDLSAIAEFYKTDAGQALIRKTPELMQAGAALGQRAGNEAGQKVKGAVADRLEQEGVIIESQSMTRKIIDALRGK